MGSQPPPDASRKPRRRYAARLPPDRRREQLMDAALRVVVEQGYEGVSIEAIARVAGVTRPVIYDHYPNLGSLLRALIKREERYALDQLAAVVPQTPPSGDPPQVFAAGVRRFLEGVASHPDTWRIILLPPEGTPAIVREQVETNREALLQRLERLVSWAIDQSAVPPDFDIEIGARTILRLSEEAGRMVLTDPRRYPPERYERFAHATMRLIWSRRHAP